MDADTQTFHWAVTDKETRQVLVRRATTGNEHAVFISSTEPPGWTYVGKTDAPWEDREALRRAAIEVAKIQRSMGVDHVNLIGPAP